jgi:hypothetical protein
MHANLFQQALSNQSFEGWSRGLLLKFFMRLGDFLVIREWAYQFVIQNNKCSKKNSNKLV